MLTLKEVIKLEPRVKAALNLAKTKPKRNYSAYEEIKEQLAEYVGVYSDNPDLRNAQAYEVCISRLATILKI